MQETQLQRKSETRIVGLVATINKSTAEEQIGTLWQHAAQSGALPADGSAAYGVYFNYQDKLANDYSLLVGRESNEPLKGEEQEVILPVASYAVFCEKGPVPQVAQSLWREIWKGGASQDQRAWTVDYEIYDGGLAHCRVAVHIGLKTKG